MARCLLLDISTAEFQAVLLKLNSHDYATLGQISRAISNRTNQYTPYIILRLCKNSSTDQLQQWVQATRCLQHIPHIHILVTNTVETEVLDSAMQLIAQRGQIGRKVTELHLTAASSRTSAAATSRFLSEQYSRDSSEIACISTVKPLLHLIADLETLVIEGIDADDMARDLQQLAAAAAAAATGHWKLLSLTMHADWGGYSSRDNAASTTVKFPAALKHLTAAFPGLHHLDISSPAVRSAAFSSGYTAVDPAVRVEQLAVLNALSAATMRLKNLEMLTMHGVPDVWQGGIWGNAGSAEEAFDRAFAAFESNARTTQLPAAAAAADATLDDYGSRLLQQHGALREVYISTANTWTAKTRLGMSWQQQQTDSGSSSTGSSSSSHAIAPAAAAAAAALPAVIGSIDLYLDTSFQLLDNALQLVLAHYSSGAAAGSSSSSSSARGVSPATTFASGIINCLSLYSSRPYYIPMRHISSLVITVNHDDVIYLADLLDNLRSLKHLEVTIQCSGGTSATGFQKGQTVSEVPPAAATMQLMAAAAAVRSLQSLFVEVDSSRYDFQQAVTFPLTANLLLPFSAAAAAAGGGGRGSSSSSSLKKLKLKGNFKTAMAALSTVSGGHSKTAAAANAADAQPAAATLVNSGTAAHASSDSTVSMKFGWNLLLRAAGFVQQLVAGIGLLMSQLTRSWFATAASSSTTAAAAAASSKPASAAERHNNSSTQAQLQLLQNPVDVAAPAVDDYSDAYKPVEQPATAAAAAAVQLAAANTNSPAEWHYKLRQLVGLEELVIEHAGVEDGDSQSSDQQQQQQQQQLLELPVESLPLSLKVLKGTRLKIITAASSSSSSLAAADAHDLEHAPAAAASTVLPACPLLENLDLRHCHITTPGILVSDQLLQLIVEDSTWQGGWAAAAAAWPNVEVLTWKFDSYLASATSSSSSSSSSSNARVIDTLQGMQANAAHRPRRRRSSSSSDEEQDALVDQLVLDTAFISDTKNLIHQVLEDILISFPRLRIVTISDLPWMSVEILQPLLQNMRFPNVRYVKFGIINGVYDVLARVQMAQAKGAGSSSNEASSSSSRRRRGKHNLLEDDTTREMLQLLQQALPWASIVID